ncbi:MAG: NAD-dependent epimerase/dehydratase family protein [Kiritimatiellae bacterium]|nr:NAD-dependent epimerase/dehydratase family protein [Kiritimatiellia bacterium]
MKILVTGAAGFVGRHLVRELLAAGHAVATTDALPAGHPATADLPDYAPADLRDAAALRALVAAARPDAAIHLAAISFVPDAAKDPALLDAVNVGGPCNLAEALLAEAPGARLAFVSTAQVYGAAAAPVPGAAPLGEDAPLRPASPYARSKADAERALARLAAERGLRLVVLRPANHTGPGQSPKFVAPSFARQALAAARGQLREIRVGNLGSVRDFSDVRDVAAAYRLALERGADGAVYNVSSGALLRIGDLLARLLELAGAAGTPVAEDPALWRPADAVPALSTARLRADTGWAPRIPIERTLGDLLAASGA